MKSLIELKTRDFSEVVKNAEEVFFGVLLTCECIETTYRQTNKRIVIEKVEYYFTYQILSDWRTLKIVRKSGNRQFLTTNIRTEIVRQTNELLKQMEGRTIEKR